MSVIFYFIFWFFQFSGVDFTNGVLNKESIMSCLSVFAIFHFHLDRFFHCLRLHFL